MDVGEKESHRLSKWFLGFWWVNRCFEVLFPYKSHQLLPFFEPNSLKNGSHNNDKPGGKRGYVNIDARGLGFKNEPA